MAGGALVPSPSLTGAMKILAPPTFKSMRGAPCCIERITSAPRLRSNQVAMLSGSLVRRWMWSQVNLAMADPPCCAVADVRPWRTARQAGRGRSFLQQRAELLRKLGLHGLGGAQDRARVEEIEQPRRAGIRPQQQIGRTGT